MGFVVLRHREGRQTRSDSRIAALADRVVSDSLDPYAAANELLRASTESRGSRRPAGVNGRERFDAP